VASGVYHNDTAGFKCSLPEACLGIVGLQEVWHRPLRRCFTVQRPCFVVAGVKACGQELCIDAGSAGWCRFTAS